MLDENVADAEQDFRRSMSKNVSDAEYWKARRALDLAGMRRDCYVDGRAYGSGSGGSDDYSVPQSNDNRRPSPHLEYTRKWAAKRFG